MHNVVSKLFGLYSPLTAGVERVEVTPIEKNITTTLPLNLETLMATANLTAMDADGRTWWSDLQKTMDRFNWEIRDLGILGAGGCSWAGGISVMNYRLLQPTLGALNANIYRDNDIIGTITDYGRWNGPRGWDDIKQIIVGVLTLPTNHNMGAFLSYFSENLPSIPFMGEWPLPTFSTDKSGVFATTSSLFTYTTRPRLITPVSFDINVVSPTKKTVWMSILTTDRREITGTEILLEGAEAYHINSGFIRVPPSGHVEITPVDMEGGAAISNVVIGV